MAESAGGGCVCRRLVFVGAHGRAGSAVPTYRGGMIYCVFVGAVREQPAFVNWRGVR